jgi:hypothetical protein
MKKIIIAIIAISIISCNKPKCWTCKSTRGEEPVCNVTKTEIKKLEQDNKNTLMKCH